MISRDGERRRRPPPESSELGEGVSSGAGGGGGRTNSKVRVAICILELLAFSFTYIVFGLPRTVPQELLDCHFPTILRLPKRRFVLILPERTGRGLSHILSWHEDEIRSSVRRGPRRFVQRFVRLTVLQHSVSQWSRTAFVRRRYSQWWERPKNRRPTQSE